MDPYRCPDCDALRDHPDAACDACDYDPHPAPDTDAALDAWEREIECQAAAAPVSL